MTKKWHVLPLFSILALIMISALLLVTPSSARAIDFPIDSDQVRGVITDFEILPDVSVDVDIDWDGFFPRLILSIFSGYEMSGHFDLQILESTLPAGTGAEDSITRHTPGIFDLEIIPDIFADLPKIGWGGTVSQDLIVGATSPADIQGHFKISAGFTLSLKDGFSVDGTSDFQYTSIRPKEPNKETTVCIGLDSYGELDLGVIEILGSELGPIVHLELTDTVCGKAEAVLHKDRWEGTTYLDDSIDELHTCTENGKDGCVSGQLVNSVECDADASAHLTVYVPFYGDVTLIDKDWPASKCIDTKNTPFVQSLTWKEALKEQEFCDHLLYKVPVRVWLDENHVKPVENVVVKNDDHVVTDATARRYDWSTTGKNPSLRDYPDYTGRANIYLPYKDGKYTVEADPAGTPYAAYTGEAEMPSPMVRGANEPVDIVLESTETRQLSVEKTWDIDFEFKDRPDSVDVLLQAQYYDTGVFTWEGIQKATLSADNNWSFTFDPVPKYEQDEEGQQREIKYRVRELKASPEDAPDPEDSLFPEDIADVVQEADGILQPDGGSLAEYSKRVVPARWDLDNTHVWEILKTQVTDYNSLWTITPSEDYLSTLGELSIFPKPTVVYKVDEYTTCVGETVDAHDTKYLVEYKEDGDSTVITNTALLETSIYKRWLLFGDADTPDDVWIVLNYRVKEKYREIFAGKQSEKVLGLWLPVWKPVDGDIYTIFSALADATDQAWIKYLNYLIKYDAISGNLTFAISKLEKPTEGIHNPLTDWRARFKIKKYGWFMIPGVPVEFQAEELTSTIITDVIKFETGLDIPISFIINPDGNYITVPGRLFQIPLLDKDWELTGNILNTWADPGDDTAIGGSKIWAGDREEDRPDSLTIVIRDPDSNDGETEIGRVEIKKSDNRGYNTWPWALRQEDVDPGIVLDPDKTYLVSEEYPDGYAHKNDYTLSVKGHDLTNTWVQDKTPKIAIQKVLQHTGLKEQREFKFNIRDDKGQLINSTPYSITMSGEGTQTLTPEIPKDKLAGKNISKFTVEEVDPSDEYTVSYSGPEQSTDPQGNPVYTFTVTNTHKELSYFLEVRWVGDTEADRPTDVKVYLRNGDDGSVWVHSQDGWKKQFTPKEPLPTKEDAGDYKIEEKPVPDGYAATYSWKTEGDKIIWVITNTKAGPVTVRGQKTWDDDDDAEGIRPDLIRISIAEQVHGIVQTVDVTADSGWAWKAAGLPETDDSGEVLKYFVMESTPGTDAEGKPIEKPGVDGYTTEYKTPTYDESTRTWTCDVINSTKTLQYSVYKIWNDHGDRYGVRPEKVTAQVLENGMVPADLPAEQTRADLSAENSWSAVFILPKETGREYTIREVDVTHYVTTYRTTKSESGDSIYTEIINTIDADLMNVPVEKTWAGDEGLEDRRPQLVTVQLTVTTESEPEKELYRQRLTLRKAENWKGTFTGVPKPTGGNRIYTLTEETIIPGYSSEVSGSALAGFTVTNTFRNETDITVRKEWVQAEGAIAHPASVPFALRQNGTVVAEGTLSEAGGWEKAFRNLPVCDENGKLYNYTVTEESELIGYKVEYAKKKEGSGIVLIIRNKPIVRSVRFKKVWDDGEDASGRVPVTVRLMKNGAAVEGKTQIIQPDEAGVEFSFDGLPVHDGAGGIISYTVTEDPVPDGYHCYIAGSMAEGFTLLNMKKSGAIDITAAKVWDDHDDEAGKRPEEITIRLTKKSTGETVAVQKLPVVDESGEKVWTWTFRDIPKFDFSESGLSVPIEYSVTEDPVSSYTTVIRGNQDTGFTITNSFRSRINVTVRKEWVTSAGSGHPAAVTFALKQNGNTLYSRETLNAANNWQKTYADLPIYDENGKLYLYSVEEDVPEGYIVSYGKQKAGFGTILTIRNRLNRTNVRFRKVWDDGEDPSATTAVTVQLVRNGTVVEGKTQVIQPEEAGKEFSFDDLPIYDDRGSKIFYSVTETPVPAGYHCYITGSMDAGYTLHNTGEEQEISVRVTKQWEPATEIPAGTITLRLRRKDTGETVAVKKLPVEGEGGVKIWTWTFEHIPKYDFSETGLRTAIEYTVTEDPIFGWTTEITGNQEEGFTVTNRRETIYADITVTKTWEGTGDDHPDTLSVTLLSDLAEAGTFSPVGTAELTGPAWTYLFEHMIARIGDRTVAYRVSENVPEGYGYPFIVHSGNSFNIHNWKSDITVDIQKEWIGDKPKDRPATLPIRLKIGSSWGETLTLTAEDGWKIHITDLPILNVEAIPITVEEDVPEGYSGTVTGGVDESGLHYHYTIRNERIPEPTHEPSPYTYLFSFRKIWSGDSEESISWTMYNGDGQVIHKKFNKKTISDTEWLYEAWFTQDVSDCYIVEDGPAGYTVYYENTGSHAGVTDRCCNGGKIINYKIPKTGDRTIHPLIWIGCILLGLAGFGGAAMLRKRRKEEGRYASGDD